MPPGSTRPTGRDRPAARRYRRRRPRRSGEQRRTNYALQDLTEDAFVAAVTEGQPALPRYFAFDARANREAHSLLDEHPPELLDLGEVLAKRDVGAVLLDAREPAEFAGSHLAGAVNIDLQGRFAE
jgi:hydroxyacylglutathione hydrolase